MHHQSSKSLKYFKFLLFLPANTQNAPAFLACRRRQIICAFKPLSSKGRFLNFKQITNKLTNNSNYKLNNTIKINQNLINLKTYLATNQTHLRTNFVCQNYCLTIKLVANNKRKQMRLTQAKQLSNFRLLLASLAIVCKLYLLCVSCCCLFVLAAFACV